jgi:hypothetical protein
MWIYNVFCKVSDIHADEWTLAGIIRIRTADHPVLQISNAACSGLFLNGFWGGLLAIAPLPYCERG